MLVACGPGVSCLSGGRQQNERTSNAPATSIGSFIGSYPRSTDPRSIGLKPSGNCLPVHQGLTGITLPIDQGSEPTLKQIFGQGLPKLHPFGLSPLINDQCYTSTVTVSNTDPRSLSLWPLASGDRDQGSGPRCRVGTSPAILPGTLIPSPVSPRAP